MQKLIAYGHFSGNKVDATNSSRKLIDRLVEVVCECLNNGRAEDAVQLQIIKVSLTTNGIVFSRISANSSQLSCCVIARICTTCF